MNIIYLNSISFYDLAPVKAFTMGLKMLYDGCAKVLLEPGSIFSIWSLLSAFGIAFIFLCVRYQIHKKPLKLWQRALFPRWFFKSASSRADIGYFFLNTFFTGALIGWGLLSFNGLSNVFTDFFHSLGFTASNNQTSEILLVGLKTLILFLAYDFAYWLDHYLKHKLPILWEFHRVHHSAEVLSPLTTFRMHPLDSLIFYNITAIIMALANGLFMSIFGNSISELAVNGVNIVLLLFIFTTIHLQHSHIDIKFTGFWGKVFFSPAHHHIHHSNNPDHYGKNMGSCLSVWDYIFGTLVLPETYKRRLKFGVDKDGVDDHSVYGGLIYPFVRAHAHTKRALSIALLQLKLLNAYSHRSKGKLS